MTKYSWSYKWRKSLNVINETHWESNDREMAVLYGCGYKSEKLWEKAEKLADLQWKYMKEMRWKPGEEGRKASSWRTCYEISAARLANSRRRIAIESRRARRNCASGRNIIGRTWKAAIIRIEEKTWRKPLCVSVKAVSKCCLWERNEEQRLGPGNKSEVTLNEESWREEKRRVIEAWYDWESQRSLKAF